MEQLIQSEILNERMYFTKLSNGLDCYIIPKKDFQEKFALLSVKYGAVDNKFSVGGQTVGMPDGIAHFLEHKMFGDGEGSAFEQFAKLGANVNAFTTLTNTAYYFSCAENFQKCLDILLNMTQNPRFTEETVDKEKGIIAQEIEMYADDPYWAAYTGLMDSMFHEYPVKKSIAGSVDSIKKISADMLYKCHERFYTPNNMTLVCVGDFPREPVYEAAERLTAPADNSEIKRLYGSEPACVASDYTAKEMQLAGKIFNLGFKDIDFSPASGIKTAEKTAATRLVLDYAFGESSEFFGGLYDMGIVDRTFAAEFLCGDFFGAAIVSSGGADPEKAAEMAINELKSIAADGIDPERLKRVARKNIGRFIRGLNNLGNIAISQADNSAKGFNLFDIADQYADIDEDGFLTRVNELLRDDNHTLSVVY